MMPLASHSVSMPRCHQRARPIEWRSPGRPICCGRLIESFLAVHSGSVRHRLLHPEPVLARGAVPGPVQPRVIGEDLPAGPDDEQQEEHVQEVLPAEPRREADRCVRGSSEVPGNCSMNDAHRRQLADALGDGDRGEQQHEPDGDQPEQVEPLAVADPHARRDTPVLRNRAREGVRVDDVLALLQLGAETVHDLGRWGGQTRCVAPGVVARARRPSGAR